MVVNISSDSEKYYMQVLHIVKNFPPFNKLRDKELEVLSWLSYYYNEFKYKFGEEDLDLVNKNVFDYETRMDVTRKIKDNKGKDLTYQNLANLMAGLKSKGFIHINEDGKKTLNPKYIFDPRRINELTYKFHFE